MALFKQDNVLNRPVALSNVFWVIIVLLLIFSNIFFASKYFSFKKQGYQSQVNLKNQETNQKVLEFTQLFIEKVLKAEGEIDFETRLKLETAVRGLQDPEILTQWNRFIESDNEAQAQEEVKNLLGLLVSKVRVETKGQNRE